MLPSACKTKSVDYLECYLILSSYIISRRRRTSPGPMTPEICKWHLMDMDFWFGGQLSLQLKKEYKEELKSPLSLNLQPIISRNVAHRQTWHEAQSVLKCSFSYLSAVWCWYRWTRPSTCSCACGSPELYSCRNPGPSLTHWEPTAGTSRPPSPRTDETSAGGSDGWSSRTASFSLCPASRWDTARARVRGQRGMEGGEEAREWEKPGGRRTSVGWGHCRSSSSEIPGRRESSCLSLLPWRRAQGSLSHSGRDIPLMTKDTDRCYLQLSFLDTRKSHRIFLHVVSHECGLSWQKHQTAPRKSLQNIRTLSDLVAWETPPRFLN